MSGGLSGLSNEDLMRQLGGSAPAAAPSGVAALSDADLLKQLAPPAPSASFDERFKAAAPSSRAEQTGALAEGLRSRADEVLVGKPDATNQIAAGVINASNALGMNLPKAGGALAATALGKVGLYPERTYAQNYELAGDQADALSRQFPKTGVAGTVAGIGAGAAVLPGFQAAKGAGLAARSLAAAGTGAAYGTAGSLLDAKDAGDVGKSALIGGVAGAALAPVAEKALDAGGKALAALAPFFAKGVSTRNSAGQFTDEARALLSRAGINPDTIDHKMERSLLDAFGKGGVTDAALNEGRAAAQGINLTKGQAAADYAQQQGETLAARNGENAGQKALGDFLNTQQEQIAARQRGIGDDLAGGQAAVDSPYAAGEMVAARAKAEADRIATQASHAERGSQEALQSIRSQNDPLAVGDAVAVRARETAEAAARAERAAQDEAATALATARGPGDTIENADIVAEGVRGAADRARTGYRERYSEAFARDGTIAPEFFQGVARREGGELAAAGSPLNDYAAPISQRISQSLVAREEPIIIDRTLTPLASATLDDLDRVASLNLGRTGQPAAGQDVAGVNLRGVEQARKIITARMRAASATPEDQRALRGIMNSFDDELERGFTSPFYSGDAEALPALQGARSAFRDYQQAFKPQGAGDDVGTAMRRIVERDARPDEVAGILYGNVRSGNVGKALRLSERLESTLGADSAEYAALRRGLVSEITSGSNMAPDRVAARIEQALTGDGRQLAQRLLTPEQTSGLRAYQRAVAQAAEARTAAPAWVNELAAANFEPQRVAERLYGSAVTGRASSAQYADGLKTFFGANSPEWTAIGQGYVSHVLGGAEMGADAIAKRVGAALAPENRMFARKLLTEEQIKGLEAVRNGINTAKLTRESMPEWISDLAKGDFDPRRVVDKMFGGTAPGSNAAAAQYTAGLKGFLGKDSAEWAAIRQAGWQQLVNKPADHVGDYGAQAQANRISEFLNAKGKTLASVLYTPQEIAQMREYATVMKMLVPQRLAGGSASPNSDTAPASAALLKKLSANGNKIATVLGGAGLASGGVVRAALGFGFGKALAKTGEAIQGRAERRFAQEAVAGAPRLQAPKSGPDIRGNRAVAVGAGLALQ